MREIVCAGAVDDLNELIRACQFPAEALFLVEMLPGHIVPIGKDRENLLRFAHFKSDIRYEQYTSGRIFHHDFELRWEKDGQHMQVIYAGVARELPNVAPVKDMDLGHYQPQIKHYYLFGERLRPKELEQIGLSGDEGYFAEVRIPRLLQYPLLSSNNRRVRLTVREYVEEKTGRVEFLRFQGLEPGGKNDESV